MTRIIFLCLFLTGCAVHTGNPVSDMVVNTLLTEAARPVITGSASPLLSLLMDDEPECVSGRGGIVFCGKW